MPTSVGEPAFSQVRHSSGNIAIYFSDTTRRREALSPLAGRAASVRYMFQTIPAVLLSVPQDVPDRWLRNLPGARIVEREVLQPMEFGEEVNWTHSAQPVGHDFTSVPWTGSGIKVGVLDNGIDCNLVEIGGCVATRDFTGLGFYDGTGHGTAVASVIAAKHNMTGIRGGAPGVSLYGARVLDNSGVGSCQLSAAGVDWLVAQGVDIINASFGALWNNSSCAVMDSATRIAVLSHGVMIVGAAGERVAGYPDTDSVVQPARYGWVMAVAGVTCDFGLFGSCQSDAHWWSPSPLGLQLDIAAGAHAIHVVRPGGVVASANGTSFATPLVTAAAAIAMERWPALWRAPLLTRDHIKAQAYSPAPPWAHDPAQIGSGLLNVLNIVQVDPCSYMFCGGWLPED